MQQLTQDINNLTFKKIYLLYGPEDYLRKQYRDKLIAALTPEGDTMNYNYYSGTDINVGEIIDQAETMPFFADRRTIVIEDSGMFKNGNEKLAEYLADSAETTVIIFVEQNVDKRGKLYKAVTANGRAVEFATQTPETLNKWILGKVKKEGKQIDGRALDVLLERTGMDMTTISVELDKLFSYTMDKNAITVNDVADIITVSTSAVVFNMVDAMVAKRSNEELDMYHDLLSHKSTPYNVLAVIRRQFTQLLQVKEMIDIGYSNRRIAERMGLSSYVIQKLEKIAKKFSYKKLEAMLEKCADVDESIKIRGMNPEMSVELMILEFTLVK